MADYQKAAADLRIRIDAKTKWVNDLNSFFESLRAEIAKEVAKANVAMNEHKLPPIIIRQEGLGEPTISLTSKQTDAKITQDRSVPSIISKVKGEAGERVLTFLILDKETPILAQRVSLAPAVESKLTTAEIAGLIVEDLIYGSP
jgi:hypothetical protein